MTRAILLFPLLVAFTKAVEPTGRELSREFPRSPAARTVGVQVTPVNGTDPVVRLANSSGNTVQFTVTNTGDVDTRYSGTCSRTGSVATVSCTSIGILIPGEQKTVTATFSTGVAGSGTVTLSVVSTQPSGASASGTWNITVANASASVTPDGASLNGAPNAASSYNFTVTNTGSATTTYSLAAICSGTAVTGCSAPSSTSALSAGQSQSITVNFTTQAAGTTGVVELQASVGGSTLNAGTVHVTIPPGPAVETEPGNVIARDQCLAISIAAASASECGDLRIAHSLPSVRTMNSWRAPTLAYNSAHAIGWASVGANVTLATTAEVPTTVTAALKIAGVTRASGSWAGSQWSPGATRRIALGFSAPSSGLGTGVYDYVLEVTNVYSGASYTTSYSGVLAVVDRSSSYFGAGWWLAGLEQWNPSTGLWVGGDGSARQYALRPGTAAPNRVWGATAVTHPDSIREVGSEFVRQLPDSVWVFYDAQGRHVRTRNRQGHVTSFGYDGGGRLANITLPPASSPLSYSLSYDGNGRVSTIVAPGVPASRTTTFTVEAATGRLTAATETDGNSVQFGYGGDHKITSRTDRRVTLTTFQYDAGSRVSQAAINLSPGSITRTLRNASSQGFAGTAVALSDVFTRLDGPRAVNTTTFYVNRHGAPDSIVDALAQRTRLYRGDSGFPGLVTQLTTVTGHTITASYDARGRILSSSEPSTSGATATTQWQWDMKWDQLTRVTNPEGDFVEFGVDAVTGNRTWQQDGRGTSTRTQFQYYSDEYAKNLISNVVPPNSGYHSYGYDAKGNLNSYFTAIDRSFTWVNNDIGLTTEIRTPTGPCCQPGGAPYQTETIAYTSRNEDTLRVTTLSGESTTLRKTFDPEGNLLQVARSFSPNTANITLPLVTSWEYDRANRRTRQSEPDNAVERWALDAAGNVDTVITRRGLAVAMTYDALDRLSTRSLPAVSFSLPASQIHPATGVNQLPYTYSWSADSQSFQYSADGQITQASNKDATVTRTYHPSGRLLTETLGIKTTDRSASHSYATTYRYDRNGRRTSLVAPSGFTGDSVLYRYETGWSALSSVTDIAGNVFTFNYNERSELTRTFYGGSITQYFAYDGDGRLRADSILNGFSQGFPYYPGPKLRDFAVVNRNARDQILTSSESVQSDRVIASYSGLGYLLTSNMRQSLVNGATGGPASYASGDTLTYDGLGNIITTRVRDSVDVGAGWTVTLRTGANSYAAATGRLSTRSEAAENTTYSYDAAGNGYFQRTTFTPDVPAERASYYASDERLAASDTRRTGRRTFEEYRYDPLGRRVWVKSQVTCEPTNAIECVTPFVRRTVWDGDQELAEVQVPVDSSNPPVEEMDTGYPLQSYHPAAGSYGDPNPFYGRVVYGPGLAIDQPLSVTRYDYRDSPSGASSLSWPRFSWQTYWNYQGVPAYGTVTSGAYAYPYQQSSGQTQCPILGTISTDRCVIVQWPLMHSAYDQNRGKVRYQSWHGSLLESKRDRSGLDYRRNRLYDPQTGRFTQEDPIGLAGGLNLYGFADGDPINFDDPFGLCPACVVVALRAIPYVVAGGRLVAEALDPNPDAGTALVQAGGRIASRAAHAAQEAAAGIGRSWSTQRRAFWRAEAAAEGAAERWGAGNIERMQSGRAAQYIDESGQVRSYELHHTPTAKSKGGTQVRPVTREEHADVDQHRRLKEP